ncbi:MAG: lipopolysaccharide biosynthesis protein [bacterium]
MAKTLIGVELVQGEVVAEQTVSGHAESVQDFKPSHPDIRPAKHGRFTTNLAANIGTLVINLLIGLWFTPYLIHHLGVASYGLIPLVTQLTGYLSIITLALNSAVGRWITIALERQEYDEANRYFNASFFGSLFLILVIAVPTGFAAGHIHRLIAVPSGQEAQTGWLMGCAFVVFFLNTLLTPFGVATYSRNRFDLQNLVVITNQLVRVAVVVIFFVFLIPQLWQVGLGMVVATLVSGGMSLHLWRRLTPMLQVSFKNFQIRAVGRLTSFGGWVAINQVGTLLFLAIDLLIVNRLFGAEAGGRYAAILQWSSLLRLLASTIAAVFGPTMLYYYARCDLNGLTTYTRRAMKFTGLLLALPIGLICGFSVPLLRTWLGLEFVSLAPLMSLMTIHLGINLAVQPLFNIQAATNRVAVPGIVTLVMGVGNLGLALLLAGPAGWGLYGVAAAGAIMLSAKNFLFTPVYSAYCLGRNFKVFFRPMLPIITMSVITAASCYGLSKLVFLSGWFRLGMAVLGVSIVYIVAVLLTQVSTEERALLRGMVYSLARKGVHNPKG